MFSKLLRLIRHQPIQREYLYKRDYNGTSFLFISDVELSEEVLPLIMKTVVENANRGVDGSIIAFLIWNAYLKTSDICTIGIQNQNLGKSWTIQFGTNLNAFIS